MPTVTARRARNPRRRRDFRPALPGAPEPLERRELMANLPAGFVESTVTTGLTSPTAMDVGEPSGPATGKSPAGTQVPSPWPMRTLTDGG